MGATLTSGVLELIDNRLEYQVRKREIHIHNLIRFSKSHLFYLRDTMDDYSLLINFLMFLFWSWSLQSFLDFWFE